MRSPRSRQGRDQRPVEHCKNGARSTCCLQQVQLCRVQLFKGAFQMPGCRQPFCAIEIGSRPVFGPNPGTKDHLGTGGRPGQRISNAPSETRCLWCCLLRRGPHVAIQIQTQSGQNLCVRVKIRSRARQVNRRPAQIPMRIAQSAEQAVIGAPREKTCRPPVHTINSRMVRLRLSPEVGAVGLGQNGSLCVSVHSGACLAEATTQTQQQQASLALRLHNTEAKVV